MYYTRLFFGKQLLTDLRLEDLNAYFAEPKEESDKLEFKSYPPVSGKNDHPAERERSVLRTICALLNSEGGVLIWGAPIMQKQTGTKSLHATGDLQPVPERYEKDAFIAKLANRMTPSPKNVLFHRIEISGGYIYLFDVAASDHAPHQFENVYYMRLDGQTLPAPHAYIEALFKKIRYPIIEGYLVLNSTSNSSSENISLDCMILFRNQTPLINDENLYCRIYTSEGLLFSYETMSHAKEITLKNVTNVIAYGNMTEAYFTLEFTQADLMRADYTTQLTFWFGGRYSPLRTCQYKIKLDPTHINRLEGAITAVMENIYVHELHEKESWQETQEEFLKRIGR